MGSPPYGIVRGSGNEVERRHIRAVLEATGWRVSGPKGAVKVLGLRPSTLRFRMKKLGIERGAAGRP